MAIYLEKRGRWAEQSEILVYGREKRGEGLNALYFAQVVLKRVDGFVREVGATIVSGKRTFTNNAITNRPLEVHHG